MAQIKWKETIHGWGKVIEDDSLEYAEKQSRLVALLRNSPWFKDQAEGEDSGLAMAVMDLEDSPDEEAADQALWEIYNLADSDLIWLEP